MARKGSLGTLTVRLKVDAAQLTATLSRAQKQIQGFSGNVSAGIKNLSARVGRTLKGLVNQFTAFAAALGVAFSFSAVVNAAANYETALVGVVKTTNLAGQELRMFQDEIGAITKRFAATGGELLELAQAAGQLGVKGGKNLALFAETMARLAVSSDVVGEEGAKNIARLLNITGEGAESIERFSSALVDLGNNSAASEAEILHMATYVGQSIGTFGATSAEILGLSAAMKSLGLRAELSGTAVGRAFVLINKRIQEGGEGAAKMAEFLGTSVENLREQFKTDSAGVFVRFLKSLRDEGDKATVTLEQLGLKGSENARVFPTLAKAVDQVEASIQRGNDAFKENTALARESEQFNQTFTATLVRFKNALNSVAVTIGNELLPALTQMLNEFAFVLNSGEKRFDAFILFIKAKLAEFVRFIGPFLKGAMTKVGADAAAAFGNAFISGLNRSIDAVNSIPLLNIDKIDKRFESGALSDYVNGFAQNQLLEDMRAGRAVGEYQTQLNQALAEYQDSLERYQDQGPELPRFDERGLPANDAAGALFNQSTGADGLPAGDGAISSALFGGDGDEQPTVAKIETVQAKVVEFQQELTQYQQDIARFGQTTFDRLGDSVTQWAEQGKVDFKGFANQAIAELARIQLKALAVRAILGLANMGGTTGSVFGGTAKFFGIAGARAYGGPVMSGQAYLVGERGPELFQPSRSGRIVPNNQLGGNGGPSVVLHQNNTYNGGASPRELLLWAQKTKEDAIKGVAELISNGGQPASQFAQ